MHTNTTPPISIAILGCGWLGTPLAKTLQARYSVIVSTTRAEQQQQLITQGLSATLLSIPCPQRRLRLSPIMQQSVLIIALPPKFRSGQRDYVDHIKSIVAAAKHNNISQLILISSTAVYEGLTGKVTEQSLLSLASDKAKMIAQAEQYVLAYTDDNHQGCVIRLGGLVGEKRYPGYFLAGKQQLLNGGAPVNLIHQVDAIGIIQAVVNQQSSGIFNGVCDTHISKQQFYQQACLLKGLVSPTFAPLTFEQNAANAKIIDNQKVQQVLTYQFRYPDLVTWLTSY